MMRPHVAPLYRTSCSTSAPSSPRPTRWKASSPNAVAEVGLEIALGAVTELVRRLLLERPLQLLRPALQALVLPIRLRLHLQEGAVVVGLLHLALPGEPLGLIRGDGSDLALVLLVQLAPRLGLARRGARSLLLADPLLDRFVFLPRDRLAAERAFLAAFHCPLAFTPGP